MSYTLHKNITTVNRTILNNKTNKYIVIHYTGNKTDTAKNNANYFKSANRGASAHYFVDKNTVYQVVEDKDASWAVGKNYGSGNLFGIVKNNNSISIEMCSDNGAIANETFNNTVSLTKSLMKKYNIPASNVHTHFEICSKICPGWDGWVGNNAVLWNKFKSAISSDSTITGNNTTGTANTSTIYRVRKSWTNSASQIGAYSSLNNAKAACKKGYSVFDEHGNIVYTINPANNSTNSSANKSSTSVSYSHKQFVKDVQAAIGAKVDGIAGSETLSKTITVSAKINRKHAVVKAIQKYLNSIGFSCGSVDGIAGNKFESAVKSYQRKIVGMKNPDGEITKGKNTWKKLLKL